MKQETASLREENTELKLRVKQLESQTDKISKVETENAEIKKQMHSLSLTVKSLVEKLRKIAED